MILFANPKVRFLKNKKIELKIIEKILSSNKYILGKNLELFEKNFSSYIGTKYSIGVANATDGLEIVLKANNIGYGSEVITTSHTATATISSIISVGATPVLNDIDENYLFDCKKFKKLITKKTKALIIVHLYGKVCDFRDIIKICKKKNILIIEDVSQAHGSNIGKKKSGSIGDYGIFSLYPTKNLGCVGDAGIITTKKFNNYKKLKMLRNYGWNASNVSKYNGRNSRLDEIQAGILNFRLKSLDIDNAKRIKIAEIYNKYLKNLPLILPKIGKNLSNVFHLYVVQTKKRDQLLKFLMKYKIYAGIHYKIPNHLHPAIKNKVKFKNLNNTNNITKKIISLPIYPELTKNHQMKVIKCVNKFFHEKKNK